jgi:hypothetical protein
MHVIDCNCNNTRHTQRAHDKVFDNIRKSQGSHLPDEHQRTKKKIEIQVNKTETEFH